MHPLSRNPRPDRLTSLTNMSFVLFLQVFLKCDRAHHSLRLPRETRSDAQKWFECDVFWTFENPSVSQLCYLFAQLHFLSSDAVSSIIFFLLFFSSPCLFSSSLFMPHSVESWTLELPFTIEVAVSVQVACSSTNWGAYVGTGRKQIP